MLSSSGYAQRKLAYSLNITTGICNCYQFSEFDFEEGDTYSHTNEMRFRPFWTPSYGASFNLTFNINDKLALLSGASYTNFRRLYYTSHGSSGPGIGTSNAPSNIKYNSLALPLLIRASRKKFYFDFGFPVHFLIRTNKTIDFNTWTDIKKKVVSSDIRPVFLEMQMRLGLKVMQSQKMNMRTFIDLSKLLVTPEKTPLSSGNYHFIELGIVVGFRKEKCNLPLLLKAVYTMDTENNLENQSTDKGNTKDGQAEKVPAKKIKRQATQEQLDHPLHGVKLVEILESLVKHYGWRYLADKVNINCFKYNPSIKVSLKFLRKTKWAREHVEDVYMDMLEEIKRKSIY